MSRTGGEILYGIHPVAEAIRAGRRSISEVVVSKRNPGQRIRAVLDTAEQAGIPVSSIKDGSLKTLSGSDGHQGIAARAGPFPLESWEEILVGISGQSVLLLLDSIMDTGNLGALVRTGVCAGVKGMVIPKDRSASPVPAVSKASAGALEHARLARVVNLAGAVKELKKKGGWIIGLDAAADRSVYETDLTGTVGVVVGGEENGLRKLIKRECDFLACIPMKGGINSLNAAVAGGVVLYEAFRQQRIAGGSA